MEESGEDEAKAKSFSTLGPWERLLDFSKLPRSVGSQSAREATSARKATSKDVLWAKHVSDDKKAHSKVSAKASCEPSSKTAPAAEKAKADLKSFEAPLCSFQRLVNSENVPMSMAEAVEQLRSICGGQNFQWENARVSGNYGGQVSIVVPITVWTKNLKARVPDVKTRTRYCVSFLHKPGCAYVFQPLLPLVSISLVPKPAFRPMFDLDPRSFHTFKLAWRLYLDFASSDFRLVVAENLQRWTSRLKAVLERPLNAVYWLLLMIGSIYRETLVQRRVLEAISEVPGRIPVIRIDSFLSLSSLLFSSACQVLYAGLDPPLQYLEWLQMIGDQNSSRRSRPEANGETKDQAFEMNEFLDLPVVVVFYGHTQQKAKDSGSMSWVGNPQLLKSYVAKYAQDNHCVSQIEQAARVYSYTSALGMHPKSKSAEWYCWNGLKACEVGVPMPSTQAAFLSPFIHVQPLALLCPRHGLKATDSGQKDRAMSKASAAPVKAKSEGQLPNRASVATVATRNEDVETDKDEEDEEASNSRSGASGDCTCEPYIKAPTKLLSGTLWASSPASFGQKDVTAEQKSKMEIEQAIKAISDYDIMHAFAAVLAGGLNLSKMVLRLHFSIDPEAYQHLPENGWLESLLTWYRDLHRLDVHGRSRYTMLLTSVLRGMLGNGFFSGRQEEALDMLRGGFGMNARRKSAFVTGHEAMSAASAGRCVIAELMLQAELYEVKPLHTFQAHVENFHQWCHSCHLLPFLKRCYRRCGIAGLAPGQHVGAHKFGTDPRHPLVLPTVPDFYYGRNYPFHKVLQYMYGGMEQIVYGIDDPKVVEKDRAALRLIPGQTDKLNHQCWFRLYEGVFESHLEVLSSIKVAKEIVAKRRGSSHTDGDHVSSYGAEKPVRTTATTGHLGRRKTFVNQQLLQQGRNVTNRGSLSLHLNEELGLWSSPSKRQSLKVRKSLSNQAPVMNKMSFGAVVKLATGVPSVDMRGLGSVPAADFETAKRFRPFKAGEKRFGTLSTEDPFFAFVQNNYPIYTYPAAMAPRQYVNDTSILRVRYSDFVSRCGTPRRTRTNARGRRDAGADSDDEDEQEEKGSEEEASMVLTVSMFQSTDMTERVRQHCKVNFEYVDEENLIMGDTGWFPGALGHRFSFEAVTRNVDHFVRAGVVPQKRLLYTEHRVVPRAHGDDEEESSGNSSGSDIPEDASGERTSMWKKANDHNRQHAFGDRPYQTVNVMLPPLRSAR